MGPVESRAPQGGTGLVVICQLPRPPHACSQHTHSARVGAGSHSPLTRLPARLGTREQNRCVRPGPAKRASEARARSLPPPPCRSTYGVAPTRPRQNGTDELHRASTPSNPLFHNRFPHPFPNSPEDGRSPPSALAPRARAFACSAPEVLAAQSRKCAGSARGGGDGGGRFGCRPLAARRRARRPPLQVRPRAGSAGGRGERGLSWGWGRGYEGAAS